MDLLFRTREHNWPLYVIESYDRISMNLILMDSGSSMNQMILKTLDALTLEAYYLSIKNIIVYGFNYISIVKKPLGQLLYL